MRDDAKVVQIAHKDALHNLVCCVCSLALAIMLSLVKNFVLQICVRVYGISILTPPLPARVS